MRREQERLFAFPPSALRRNSLVLFVLLCVLTSASAVDDTVLRVAQLVASSHFDLGFQLGSQTRAEIQRRLAYDDIQQSIIPFLKTSTGKAALAHIMSASEAYCSWCIDEMQGIAAGSNNTLTDIYILNALAELQVLSNASASSSLGTSSSPSAKRRGGHCTDVISVPSPSEAVWGHNEDGSEGDRHTCFLVNATLLDPISNKVKDRFVAFGYAGTVAGLAYGWNHHGIVFTVNSLYPNDLNLQSPMAQVVGRKAYSSSTIEHAAMVAASGRGTSGFNMNIGSVFPEDGSYTGRRVLSVEVDSNRKSASIHETSPLQKGPPSFFFHMNMYLVLMTNQSDDPSSDARLAVLSKNYAQANTTHDVATMLGDTSNPNYPVYNGNGTFDDPVQTLTTAVFDLMRGTVDIYDTNPGATKPAYSWSLFL